MLQALIGALVIGLSLGLFGSGGSILTVPVLLYFMKMPAALAIASSLLIVGGISLFSAALQSRKQLISWSHVGWFGVPGMLGTYAGAWLGSLVDSRWQLLLFVVLMALAAVLMWQNRTYIPTTAARHPVKMVAEGAVVGIITGFVGVGGGFLIIPALVLIGGLSMPVAVGTSLMIIALKSFTGFSKYYVSLTAQGYVFDWMVIVTMISLGILGSLVGVNLGQKLPKLILQRGFSIFLLVMATVVLWQSVI